MKKIALFTFYKNNYGSILQCYSIKAKVENFGLRCDVICQKESSLNPIIRKPISALKIISYILYNKDYLIKLKSNQNDYLSDNTKELMKNFVEKTISPVVFTKKEINSIDKNAGYDYYIVGSDQVWNVYVNYTKFFFLPFAPRQKKVAFSVSLGSLPIERRYLRRLKQGAKSFPKISTREQSGKDLLESLTNISVEYTNDPTFMLNKNEWLEMVKGSHCEEQSYVLLHFIDTPSQDAINSIEKYLKSNEICVISIGYNHKEFNFCNAKFLDGDPFDYVSMIMNAEYVFTDSYHTTLFSINLEKNFSVFERQYAHRHPQSNRISDILERYNLKDCYYENNRREFRICSLDYDNVRRKVEQDRSNTIAYLAEAVNVHEQ